MFVDVKKPSTGKIVLNERLNSKCLYELYESWENNLKTSPTRGILMLSLNLLTFELKLEQEAFSLPSFKKKILKSFLTSNVFLPFKK